MTVEVKNHDNGPVQLDIIADDPNTDSGASHMYTITSPTSTRVHVHIPFQRGGVEAHGINGITHEALLSVILHRLEGFQSGPFVCDENAEAIMYIKAAMDRLNTRTTERMNRGVEGQEVP